MPTQQEIQTALNAPGTYPTVTAAPSTTGFTVAPPNTNAPVPSSQLSGGALNLPVGTPANDGSALAISTQALNPPAPAPDGSSTPSTDNALNGDYSTDSGYQKSLTDLNTSEQQLQTADNSMPSQVDLLDTARAAGGVNDKLSKVNELQKQLDAANAAFNLKYTQADLNTGGATDFAVTGYQGAVRRQQAVEAGNIATQLATAQGQYDTAEKLAEQTATLQFSDWQNKINNIKDFINLNQDNLSRSEKLAVSKMTASAAKQQAALDEQKDNVQLAMTTGVKTQFVNKNGKFFNTADGKVYDSPEAFFKAAGVANFDEAYKKGLVSDINGQTLDNMDFVKQARAKYSDVSIPLNATQSEVAQIIKGSKTYQGEQLDNQLKSAQISKIYSDQASIANDKTQQALEQQYRQILVKEVSSRSGTVGTEDAKVAQANHLASLMDQYYDPKTGNYNVPQAQYGELVLGLAGMLSKTGTPTDSQVQSITTATAKGDLNKALQYATGSPQNGSTQAVIKNLADSIDRQARTAESNREAGLNVLRGLAPTDLEPTRAAALEQNTLVPYSGISGVADPKIKAMYTPDVVSQIRTLAKSKGYNDSDLQQMVNNEYTPDQVKNLLQ